MAEGFVIYRLPGSSQVNGIRGQFSAAEPHTPGEEAFFLQPWDRLLPAEKLTGEISRDPAALQAWAREASTGQQMEQQVMTEHAWHAFIEDIQSQIHTGKLAKAVASRVQRIQHPVQPFRAFEEALNRYQGAFVYLLYHSLHGYWLGATPELLLSAGQDGRMKTMALAGTLLPGHEKWSAKEEEENAATREMIEGVLMAAGAEELSRTPVADVQSGKLKHLAVTYEFRLPSAEPWGLLKALHPTPAVAGLPLEAALEVIRKHEVHDRRLYSGWAGVSDGSGFRAYVNLRCAQLDENGAWLYAGAGINKGSDWQAEWRETEAKMQVISVCLKGH